MKRILKIVGVILVVFIGFLFWYDYAFSMDVIEEENYNENNNGKNLLIASQGSDYKNEIVANVVNEFKDKDIKIKVIDVTTIGDEDVQDWDAFLIMHTIEIWEPEENAKSFLDANYDSENMVVLATSGSGDIQMDGIDGMTGASIMENVQDKSNVIISKLIPLLAP